MFEEKLNINLSSEGYHRINSNAQGIYLYCKIEETQITAISVIQAVHGDEYTTEQYTHILNQIRENLSQSNPQPLKLLNLVLTLNPDKARHLCMEDNTASHWIVDLSNHRLMIYETQSADFGGVNQIIEELLMLEQKEREQHFAQGQSQEISQEFERKEDYIGQDYEERPRVLQFTLINTILVVANIIIYLVTHYTNAFGSPNMMYLKGGLSWHRVMNEGEYYRILTSMFMHANWSHLFGNMLVLFFLGTNLERTVGKIKYILIYFGAGILAGLASIGYNMWQDYNAMGIGASGAIFGVVGALLFIILIHRGYHNGISATQVIIFTGLNIYNGVVDSQIDQVAHVGGFIAGFILCILLYRKRKQKLQNQ